MIIQNWSVSLILVFFIISLWPSLHIDNIIFYQWYAVTCLGFIFFRTLIRFTIGLLRKLGFNKRVVAVVGTMPSGIELLKSFQEQPWLGFVVKGVYDDEISSDYQTLPYAGDINTLINDAKAGSVDRIYIALGAEQSKQIKNIARELTNTTCSVLLVPDLFTFNILQSRTEEINGVPVVPLFDTPLNGINMVFKRLEDIIVSSIILLLISPILIIISCIVKFTSPGPVFFRQIRYGMDGKPIRVWKFRSMTVMENDSKVVQATKNDVRVTKVGKFLRSTSLDELPQFFNVLFGQMSVVGPRPHAVAHNEQYRSLIQGYMLRHKVKPGITGLAQINGWRGETDTLEKMEKRIEYDLLYIRGWSIWLDLKIIFLTVFKGFINKSAY
ncbi:putative colanic acid biosysnthesis UDP-glucose lipid carrier transferase [Klebsiella quasipneumoniae]|nr:putative colanic acid biosysnthesis UDP-glucose lipid carrier transferase [Klebsiella quasipneumoniae]SMC48150.1 putative colanic acid biosysnthesis UDP-glucose lipid carrier transferase [Klebsiella quasipneumoniae]